MGNWFSTNAPVMPIGRPVDVGVPDEVYVLLVGSTETGKSHFLAHAVGDGITPVRPTFGTKNETCIHHGISIQFMEIGSVVCRSISVGDDGHSTVCDTLIEPFFTKGLQEGSQRACYMMWFIDDHDSREDILAARNTILFIQRYLSLRISLSLMIIHNEGRPHRVRRPIKPNPQGIGLAWDDNIPVGHLVQPAVKWESLWSVFDVDVVFPVKMFPRVAVKQFSYLDRKSIDVLLDWFLGE